MGEPTQFQMFNLIRPQIRSPGSLLQPKRSLPNQPQQDNSLANQFPLFKLPLGAEVLCRKSGLKGVIVARHQYLGRAHSYTIFNKQTDSDFEVEEPWMGLFTIRHPLLKPAANPQ